MYDSIKDWINVPYVIKNLSHYTGSGTKLFNPDVHSKCYPVGDVKLVTNVNGTEVISTTQLYVDGSEPIEVTDAVVFNGQERPVLRITDYYRNGVVDLRVVYL